MDPIYFLIILIVIAGGFFLLYRALKPKEVKEDSQGMVLIQQQLMEVQKRMDAQLGESRKEMTHGVEQMLKSLIDVTREQTKTNEQTRQFVSIAEQLGSLEKTLRHQKQRGNLGEASLELILTNILPPGSYKMQYPFKNGEVVDAAIITKDGIIPVDAKFSLDNYNRVTNAIDDKQREELEKDFKNDLKKRIDETSKYIRSEEGTLPFAFMFIPAEGIYYDLLVNEVGAVKVNTRNLIDYAYNEKKVIIVSPTTFAAYLQSVLYGLKAFKIEQATQDIVKRIGELQKHWKAHEDFMLKLGNAMNTTVNHYNAAYKELGKVDKDVMRITGEGVGFEVQQLSKPNTDE